MSMMKYYVTQSFVLLAASMVFATTAFMLTK